MPVVEVAILIEANQYARKNPDNVGKILDIAEILNLAADITSNTMTKEQFVSLVEKVDSEWGVLGVALYNFYTENVTIPKKYEKHGEILRKLSMILKDSVLGVAINPAK